MIKYCCDLCGKEIESCHYMFTVYIKDYQNNPVSSIENQLLCHECLRLVFQRIRKREQLKEQAND